MGVRGLYYYVAKVLGLKTVPLAEPLDLSAAASSNTGWSCDSASTARAGVVFDGESMCYWATESPLVVGNRVDSVHGGESLHMFATFMKYFERFVTEKVPICVVFDGIKVEAKRKTLLKRRQSRYVGNKLTQQGGTPELTSEMFDRCLFTRQVMLEALTELAMRDPNFVKIQCAVGEGDSDCVRLARQLNAYAVVGNDFDYVVLMSQAPEVKYISIFSIMFTGTMHRSYPGWRYKKNDATWVEFTPENCETLHVAFTAWFSRWSLDRHQVQISESQDQNQFEAVTFMRSDADQREISLYFTTQENGNPVVWEVQRPRITFRYYDSPMIATALGVDASSLPVLATFIGSDFLPQSDLRKFHEDIGVLKQPRGGLKLSDIIPAAAATVRESIGGPSADSLHAAARRLLSVPQFGIDVGNVDATMDFFTLRPLQEELAMRVWLQALQLWQPFRAGLIEPNVLRALSAGGILRCPPTLEIGLMDNCYHSNMNHLMAPLMDVFGGLFEICLSVQSSLYHQYAPDSLQHAIFSRLGQFDDGDSDLLGAIRRCTDDKGRISAILELVEERGDAWGTMKPPRGVLMALPSVERLSTPTVDSVRHLVINGLGVCSGGAISFAPESMEILLRPTISDSTFLDLCSVFTLIGLGYPALYNQKGNHFEEMADAYVLCLLMRSRREAARGTDSELREIHKSCLRLQPLREIPSERRNRVQSFMSALAYGQLLINQVAVILLGSVGEALLGDYTWSPSFKDLIDGRLYHFMYGLISSDVVSAEVNRLKGSEFYLILRNTLNAQCTYCAAHANSVLCELDARSESDIGSAEASGSDTDSDEDSDSDDEHDIAAAQAPRLKRKYQQKCDNEHSFESTAFAKALSLLEPPLESEASGAAPQAGFRARTSWPPTIEAVSNGYAPKDDREAAGILRAKGDEWSTTKIVIKGNMRFERAVTSASYTPHVFQLKAFRHIEAGNSTLVLAPTGSGKTDIALCAIYQVLQLAKVSITKTTTTRRSRVAVVVPTKALANQMFSTIWARLDVDEKNVGIWTGAVRYNTDASVVVTIAQSLLQRLYEGSFDYTHVVLDEFHSILKKEDGYVWENIVNLIPQGVQIVGLTATLPNYEEVFSWLKSVHPTFELVTMKGPRPVKQEICVFARGGLSRIPQYSVIGSSVGGVDRTEKATEWEKASLQAVEAAVAYDNERCESLLREREVFQCPFSTDDMYGREAVVERRADEPVPGNVQETITELLRLHQFNGHAVSATDFRVTDVKDRLHSLISADLNWFSEASNIFFTFAVDLCQMLVRFPADADKALIPLVMEWISKRLSRCGDVLVLSTFFVNFSQATIFSPDISEFTFSTMAKAVRRVLSGFSASTVEDEALRIYGFFFRCGFFRRNDLPDLEAGLNTWMSKITACVRDDSLCLNVRAERAARMYMSCSLSPIEQDSVATETEIIKFLLEHANDESKSQCALALFSRLIQPSHSWSKIYQLLNGLASHISLSGVYCLVDMFCCQCMLRGRGTVSTANNNVDFLQFQVLDAALTSTQRIVRRRLNGSRSIVSTSDTIKNSDWVIQTTQIGLTLLHRISAHQSCVPKGDPRYAKSVMVQLNLVGALHLFHDVEKKYMNISKSEIDPALVDDIDQSRLYRSVKQSSLLNVDMTEKKRTRHVLVLLQSLCDVFWESDIQREVFLGKAALVTDLGHDYRHAVAVNPFLHTMVERIAESYYSGRTTLQCSKVKLLHAKSLFSLLGFADVTLSDDDYFPLSTISDPIQYFNVTMGLPFSSRHIEFLHDSSLGSMSDEIVALIALRLCRDYDTAWVCTRRILPHVPTLWTVEKLKFLLENLIEIYKKNTPWSRQVPRIIGLLLKAGLQVGSDDGMTDINDCKTTLKNAVVSLGEDTVLDIIRSFGHEKALYIELLEDVVVCNADSLYQYVLLWNHSFKGLSELRERLDLLGVDTACNLVLVVLCRIAVTSNSILTDSRDARDVSFMQRHEAVTVSFLLLEAFGYIVKSGVQDIYMDLARQLHSYMCSLNWERNIRVKMLLAFQLVGTTSMPTYSTHCVEPGVCAVESRDPSKEPSPEPVHVNETNVASGDGLVADADDDDDLEDWELPDRIPKFNLSAGGISDTIDPPPEALELVRNVSNETGCSEVLGSCEAPVEYSPTHPGVSYLNWCYAVMLRQAQRAFSVRSVKDDTCYAMCKYLQKHEMLPAIVFTFAKRPATEAAVKLADMYDLKLLSHEESLLVELEINRVGRQLLDTDLINLIKRGIGLHHGDISDFDRSFVEVLLNLRLVKIVFCTSSLAEGVHMPCSTVCLYQDNPSYIDDKMFRQCIGRAGRQGQGVGQGNIIISGNFTAERIHHFLKGVNPSNYIDGESRFFPLAAVYPSSRFELHVANANNAIGAEDALTRPALCTFEPGSSMDMNSIVRVTKEIISLIGNTTIRSGVRLVNIDLQLRPCFVHILRRHIERIEVPERLRLATNWSSYRKSQKYKSEADKKISRSIDVELLRLASVYLVLICSCCTKWEGARADSVEGRELLPLLPGLPQEILSDAAVWNKVILACVLKHGRRHKLSEPLIAAAPPEDADGDPFFSGRLKIEQRRVRERVSPLYDGLSGHSYGYTSCGLTAERLYDITDIPFESLPLIDLDVFETRRKHGYLHTLLIDTTSSAEIVQYADIVVSKCMVPLTRLSNTLKDLRRIVGTLILLSGGAFQGGVICKNDVFLSIMYVLRSRIDYVTESLFSHHQDDASYTGDNDMFTSF